MSKNMILNNLEKRNNSLKSKLLHEQLKYGNYNFSYFNKYSQLILNEYRQHNSLFKSALNVGMNYEDVLRWYVQGQMGNSIFIDFYNSIKQMTPHDVSEDEEKEPETIIEENLVDGEYEISQYGDGWSYKTFIDGEKIFLISGDLDKLKEKVKAKRLPLD